MQTVMRSLKDSGIVNFKLISSSTLKRALQTAEVTWETFITTETRAVATEVSQIVSCILLRKNTDCACADNG